MDRETGRSRGFAFVTYTSAEEAGAAITGMDGKVRCTLFIKPFALGISSRLLMYLMRYFLLSNSFSWFCSLESSKCVCMLCAA